MKVILKTEVDNLGLAGDVVDVADGYGRNFLLPRGMAIVATKGAMKEAQALLKARKTREAATVGDAQAAAEALEARTMRIEVRVDDRGHLYGSVGRGDIAKVLKERGHDIPEKRIDLSGTIKEIGTYEVPVQVHPQVVANVQVEVLDIEGEVIAGQIKAYEPPPLPGEEPEVDETLDAETQQAVAEAAASDAAAAGEMTSTDDDSLVEQAIAAALEYEAANAGRLDGDSDSDDSEAPAEG